EISSPPSHLPPRRKLRGFFSNSLIIDEVWSSKPRCSRPVMSPYDPRRENLTRSFATSVQRPEWRRSTAETRRFVRVLWLCSKCGREYWKDYAMRRRAPWRGRRGGTSAGFASIHFAAQSLRPRLNRPALQNRPVWIPECQPPSTMCWTPLHQ